MPEQRSIIDYINDILDAMSKAEKFIGNMTYSEKEGHRQKWHPNFLKHKNIAMFASPQAFKICSQEAYWFVFCIL